MGDAPMSSVEIVDYRPQYAEAFRDINLEWIEEMFAVEAIDLEVLSHPQEHILDHGGHILVALLDGEPVGVGALKKTSPGCYELTKMGVRPAAQGHRVGARLLQALVDRAAELKAEELYLLSSHKCAAAVHLYEKFGFVHDAEIMARFGALYERCSVAMSYPLRVSELPAGSPTP